MRHSSSSKGSQMLFAIFLGVGLATTSLAAHAQMRCENAFGGLPKFTVESPASSTVFFARLQLVSEAKHIPETEIALSLMSLRNAIAMQSFGQASILSRIASEADQVTGGTQSPLNAMIDIIDVTLSASDADLMILQKAFLSGTDSALLFEAFKSTDSRIQSIIKIAVSHGRMHQQSLRDYLAGFQAPQASQTTHARMATLNPSSNDQLPNVVASVGTGEAPNRPTLVDRFRFKFKVGARLLSADWISPEEEFLRTIHDDVAWDRMEAIDQVLVSPQSKQKRVSLEVRGGSSFYTRMQNELDGKTVIGVSINSRTGTGTEFRGRFVSVKPIYAGVPRLFVNSNFAGLDMEITIEVKGEHVTIPIFNGNAILFASAPR